MSLATTLENAENAAEDEIQTSFDKIPADSYGNYKDPIEPPPSLLQEIFHWFQLPHTTSWSGHILSVNLTARYGRHLVWAKDDGEKLLSIVVARYQVTTVFLSLLVSADLAVFFSPSDVVEEVRKALKAGNFSLNFMAGLFLSISILLSIGALIANFTAWSVFVVLSKENAGVVLRSSLGLYSAQLPGMLVILSIYSFSVWIAIFWFVVLPPVAALTLSGTGIVLIWHIASTYSAMGNVIMATSAMSPDPILTVEEREKLTPRQLYHVLLTETLLAKHANVPINKQYRTNYKESLLQQKDVSQLKRPRRRKNPFQV